VASYLALTFVVLLVLEVPLAVGYGNRERDQISTTLQRDAFVIANYSEETLEGDAHADIQRYVEGYQRHSGGRVVVTDANARIVADSGSLGLTTAPDGDRPPIHAALDGHLVAGTGRSPEGEEVMYVAVPVTTSGQTVGAVEISYSTDQVDARIHRYWLVLAGLGLASLVAAALLGVVLSKWVARPLLDIRRAAIRLGRGDLAARAGTDDGPPEVQEVSAAFDEMARRLEELVNAQQAFVADASHQLRTPLTALRLRLENLESEVGPDARDDLAGARRETHRLSRLVDGLLTLARADRRGDRPDRQVVDVGAVIADRIDTWRPIADEYGVDLVGEPCDLEVDVAPDRVAQILDNLLANATDASPRGRELRVHAELSADGAWIELHVVDQGPGLDAEQRRHAFDRFWRAESDAADPDRAGADLGGSGLGLAIVRQLVVADHGQVELAEAPGGGIDAVVRYPARDG
jgi:signal transduction histidine kinase